MPSTEGTGLDARIAHQRQKITRTMGSLSVSDLVNFVILEALEVILAALDDLNAAVSNLQTQVSAENVELASVVSSLQTVSQQLGDLQAQVASGGAVTSDQLEAVASTITDVANSAAAAVAAASPPPPPPPAAPGV